MTPATKAIICTAHLLMMQNPKARLRSHADWLQYLALVRDWCLRQEIDGIIIYGDAPTIEQCTTH